MQAISKRTWSGLSLLVLLVAGAWAQQVPRLTLHVRDEVAVAGEYSGSISLPVRCDSHGAVFFRYYVQSRVDTAPVLKVTSDGKASAVFSLDSVPGFKRSAIDSFTVGPYNKVFILGRRSLDEKDENIEADVVAFDDDGKEASVTKLPAGLVGYKLAVFPSGQFLVSGVKQTQVAGEPAGSTPRYEPYTAVFDPSGNLVKELSFPGDVAPPKDELPKGERKPTAVFPEISRGDAVVGEDGNIYLMRNMAEPLVYVISASGTLVRKFRITPPSEKAMPRGMKYGSGGRLVFMFTEEIAGEKFVQLQIYSLVDAETGERLIDYQVRSDAGGAFACYSPNGFTFLGHTEDDHLAVEHAVPR